MHILFLNQFFPPDNAATGQLLSDLVEHLRTSGQDVDVICGTAAYGDRAPGSRPEPGIARIRNFAFSRTIIGRIFSYLSFLFGALFKALRLRAPDVVVTLTTPPLLSLVGLAVQKLRGARHVIWEMDVYPDVAIDLGVLKADGFAARLFGWLADIPRRQADKIIVLGECMRKRLLAHGIPESKIVIAENWAEDSAASIRELRTMPPSRESISILYSGNFGMAHEVNTLAAGLVELMGADSGGVSFICAGGGSRYSWLKEFAGEHDLKNVKFLPYCERGELGARLSGVHIGLATQRNECLGSAVPSKTYGIMAAGRPILFIGPKDATPALIVKQHGCGWQIDCGDVQGLVELLVRLKAHPELIAEAGLESYKAFMAYYQRGIGVERIAQILESKCQVEVPAIARELAL